MQITDNILSTCLFYAFCCVLFIIINPITISIYNFIKYFINYNKDIFDNMNTSFSKDDNESLSYWYNEYIWYLFFIDIIILIILLAGESFCCYIITKFAISPLIQFLSK